MNDVETALSLALAKTGFPFEHHVFQETQRHGWVTRTNRLYVDAEEDKTREMDLLCYRQTKGKEVTTCTAILISCKARTAKPWVLLTRDWPTRQPSWYPYPPVPVWTNSPALKYEVERPAWGLDYFNLADATGLTGWAADSPREVFALQEFEAKYLANGKTTEQPAFNAKGDASLYEGTMSLLKALAYETTAVKTRRQGLNEKIVYQFNLVQLLDGDLYEAKFGTAQPQVAPVERYRYFARTMLDGKEFSARIEFCTRKGLPKLLGDLAKVHDYNALHFNGRVHSFYEDIAFNEDRLHALLPMFETALTAWFQVCEPQELVPKPGWVALKCCKPGGSLKVQLNVSPEVVRRLNAGNYFPRLVNSSLQGIYRFHGGVEIEEYDDDIPF